MSHEIDLLDCPKIPRKSAHIDDYVPRLGKDELRRGNDKIFIGVTASRIDNDEAFIPVEINIGKKDGPSAIFIVGDDKTAGKEELLLGALNYIIRDSISDRLNLSIIADKHDPNRLIRAACLNSVSSPNVTTISNRPQMTKMIDAVAKKLDVPESKFTLTKLDPNILIIENLGRMINRVLKAEQYERFQKIKEILNYKGGLPMLTLVTAKSSDLPYLTNNGVVPGTTNAVWLYGYSDSDSRYVNINPGVFYAWGRKEKSLLPYPVMPFDLVA